MNGTQIGCEPRAKLPPSTVGDTSKPREVEDAFREWILAPEYPCVGAKAAFNAGTYVVRLYEELSSATDTLTLAQDLRAFTKNEIFHESEFATFIAVFRTPVFMDEAEFEKRLWSQLGQLNAVDAGEFPWNSEVSSDPADPQFSFSFAGEAFYVIGLHPQSSRHARTFPYPALIFNPHEQFERLRTDGKWKRIRETIRERDVQLQGSINPMLSDFGESSEARQYSGRAVEPGWQPPFTPATPAPAAGRCPFGHH